MDDVATTMTKNPGQIEEILFEGLVTLDDPQERVFFLDQTCRENPKLRARLELLVSLHDQAEEFFGMDPELDSTTSAVSELGKTSVGDFTEGLGTRIGRYRLLDCLGEGGHGVVYQAEQLEPVRRRVALKIIRMGMDTAGIIARFEMERQALALMDHPNIAHVLDAGATSSGRPFFVMEMVTGTRITDFCDQNQLDLPARLRLFISVCMAIQHAHQKGIIHCDIKPTNVLVALHDGLAVPKVIDFGIAKATEGGHPEIGVTSSSPFIGTPAYMSPEQVDGDGLDVDTRSDIYSLGVLLYELLTGKPPRDSEAFKNASPEEIRQILKEAAVPKPSERLSLCSQDELREWAEKRHTEPAHFAKKLQGDLDAIIMTAMAHDRQKRYVTVNGFVADILRYLNNEPVAARSAGRGYFLGKLIRRNKVAFTAGTVVALALSGGFGVSTWLLIRENRAHQEQARLTAAAERARVREVKLREKAQAGEIVANAAVLISHGQIAEADRLLDVVELDNVPASLESASTFNVVGDWLLHEGRWEDASKRFASVAQAMAQADKSHSSAISIHFVAAAAAVSDAGNMDLYERLRAMAAERFSTATDPYIADEVVKVCLIKPADHELLAKLGPLLRVLENHLPWDRTDDPGELMEAWQTLSLSLAGYRLGDVELSLKWADRCLQHPNQIPSRTAAVQAVLAMALDRSGRTNEAKLNLDAARAEVKAHFDKPFEIGTSSDGFWFDWMIARTLLQEADRAIAR